MNTIKLLFLFQKKYTHLKKTNIYFFIQMYDIIKVDWSLGGKNTLNRFINWKIFIRNKLELVRQGSACGNIFKENL